MLLALGRDGFSGSRKDLAALAGVSLSSLYRALQQLGAKGFVRSGKERLTVMEEAEETMTALEATIADWKSLRLADFTQEETEAYKALHRRVRQNVRKALQ